MRNSISPRQAPAAAGARLALAGLALLLALLLSAGVARAAAPVKIVAPARADAAEDVRFAADAAPDAERVSFYVDGRRRWVDSSPGWEFGRDGLLPTAGLASGRHELMVRAQGRTGSATTKRSIYVARRTATKTRGGGATPASDPAPASTPSVAPTRASTPVAKPAPVAKPESAPTTAPVSTPPPAPTTAPAPAPSGSAALLDAGFESNLANWNVAGVGEAMPTVTSALARSGSKSCQVRLTGTQNRSELILGGNGGGSTTGTVEFHEGDEYWYGFSLNIQQMVYGKPGAHNLFMQFKSDGEGSPAWGLQLWNVDGKKGLWSGGNSMQVGRSGERFLAPVSERQWHDIAIHFKASSRGAGFYEVFLDGALVDSQSGVSMIVPGHSAAYIKNGLYRNGGAIPGTSEIDLDSAKLGTSLSAVTPG